MMRVAHISGARSWRGAEQQICYLLQGNTTQVSNYLFCPQESALHKKAGNFAITTGTYTKRFGFDPVGAWKLKRFVQEQGITLLHIHDSHALNLFWLARIFGLRVPAVLTRHVNFRPGNSYKYRGDAIRRIICVSHAVQNTMAEITTKNKLVLIHPGIEITEATRTNVLRNTYGINSGDWLIGTVCALEKEKDLSAFIRIIHALTGKHPNLHAVIIGEGSERPAIETMIQRAGLQQRLHLAGFRNDVAQCLADLDLFLFTSTGEGFPLAPAEAMLAGVPVIARNCSGINELLTDGSSGILFDSEAAAITAISDLLQDVRKREQLTKQGLEQAKQFSVAELIEKTHTLYTEIHT